MTILVTGASGFLGLNLIKYFTQSHPDTFVYGADLIKPRSKEIAALGQLQDRVRFEILDVTNAKHCSDLLHDLRPKHVIHAAAVTMSAETRLSKLLVRNASYQGTENLLRAAQLTKFAGRFIALSSSAIYKQTTGDTPCEENDPLDIASAYALAKRDAELSIQLSNKTSKFVALAARIGPVYGLFERTRSSRPQVSLVRRLLDHLCQRRAVKISGSDVSRDWTYAADVAHALNLLLHTPRLSVHIYNVSSGVSVSTNEVIVALAKYGLSVQWTGEEDADIILRPEQTRKPMSIERLVGDTRFSPRFQIESGLADLIATEGQDDQLQEEDSK